MTTRSRRKRPDITQLIDKYGLDSDQLTQVLNYFNAANSVEAMADLAAFLLAARSSLEAKIRAHLPDLIFDEFGAKTVFIGYEWVTLKLPGGTYTPDFSCLLDTGRWVRVEVKGSHKQSNYRDARSKLRAAATLNPWDYFFEAMPQAGGVIGFELIQPDPDFLVTINGIFTLHNQGTDENG